MNIAAVAVVLTDMTARNTAGAISSNGGTDPGLATTVAALTLGVCQWHSGFALASPICFRLQGLGAWGLGFKALNPQP